MQLTTNVIYIARVGYKKLPSPSLFSTTWHLFTFTSRYLELDIFILPLIMDNWCLRHLAYIINCQTPSPPSVEQYSFSYFCKVDLLFRGDTCYRTTVLSYYFNIWRTASRNAELHRKVALLHRRHMLQKGMNAFKWAINRSKLQQGILQDRVSMMLLQSIFTKVNRRFSEVAIQCF